VAVKLRLMRMGKKKQPTYRIVAADARSPRDGRFIEIVGTYDPRAEPSGITLDNERAVHWLRHGAQPTERVQKLLTIAGAWEEFTGEAPAPAPASRSKAEKRAEARATAEAEAAANAPVEEAAPAEGAATAEEEAAPTAEAEDAAPAEEEAGS
jgi:small subunit ribosomal protein S16